MALHRYDTVLRLWVLAALVVGSAFISLMDAVVTPIGVVLIILGLVSLIPIVTNALTANGA